MEPPAFPAKLVSVSCSRISSLLPDPELVWYLWPSLGEARFLEVADDKGLEILLLRLHSLACDLRGEKTTLFGWERRPGDEMVWTSKEGPRSMAEARGSHKGSTCGRCSPGSTKPWYQTCVGVVAVPLA